MPIQLALLVSILEDIEITEAKIKVHISAGPNHVPIRTIKELKMSRMLCLLANAMLKFKQEDPLRS